MLAFLGVCFLAALAYMTLWFIVGTIRGRSDVADVAWGGTFIATVLCAFLLGARSSLALLVSLLVTVWGVRLSQHIYARNRRKTEDTRYKELKAKWGNVTPVRIYTRIFLVQAVLATLIALPVLVINYYEFSQSWLVWLGIIVWVFGFCFEVIGDAQLKNFLKNKTSSDQILSSGLWAYSRHPNYFGEVCGWWGLWVVALAVPYGWVTIIGPLTITYLILFVSGVPLLENRYKDNKNYQAYAKKTNKFIPWFPGA